MFKKIKTQMPKTLCIFAYNERSPMFTENLKYFIRNALFESTDVTFCLVISGTTTLEIEEKSNFFVLRRSNVYGDFGAWGFALDRLGIDYDYFIFINDTCRGPYIPNWAPKNNWVCFFTQQLNDTCKLVGPTKNSTYHSHVQSYAFATDKYGLQLFLKDKIFHPTLHYPLHKTEFILEHEVRMSKLLIDKGFEIKEFFHGTGGITPYANHMHISPFEVMFVKTNTSARLDMRQIAIGGGAGIPTISKQLITSTDKSRRIVLRSSLQK